MLILIIVLLTLNIYWGFPCGSAGKESPCNAGDLDSIPGLGRSPGEGNNYPRQYSYLENSMDRGAMASYSPWGHKELIFREKKHFILKLLKTKDKGKNHQNTNRS